MSNNNYIYLIDKEAEEASLEIQDMASSCRLCCLLMLDNWEEEDKEREGIDGVF